MEVPASLDVQVIFVSDIGDSSVGLQQQLGVYQIFLEILVLVTNSREDRDNLVRSELHQVTQDGRFIEAEYLPCQFEVIGLVLLLGIVGSERPRVVRICRLLASLNDAIDDIAASILGNQLDT